MREIEQSVETVAAAFSATAGNDMRLGEKFRTDFEVITAWNILRQSEEGQTLFMKKFDAVHGNNPEITGALHTIIKDFANSAQHITRFQAIGFVISRAENAYMSGGPT